MTRRSALTALALVSVWVRKVEPQTITTRNSGNFPTIFGKPSLYVDLGSFTEFRMTLNGETVTLLPAEIMAALKEKP